MIAGESNSASRMRVTQVRNQAEAAQTSGTSVRNADIRTTLQRREVAVAQCKLRSPHGIVCIPSERDENFRGCICEAVTYHRTLAASNKSESKRRKQAILDTQVNLVC